MDVQTQRENIQPRKPVYPLRMETLPIQQQSKDTNIIQSTQQDLPKESEITDSPPNKIVTTLSENDLSTTRNKKKQIKESRKHDYENDEDFQFKRHRNKTGLPSLTERLDSLQNKLPPKRMENFDSSFPVRPSSHANPSNTTDAHKASSKSSSTSSSPSVTKDDSINNHYYHQQQFKNAPFIPPNNNVNNNNYPHQMYPMYYVPIPTSPINPQYYPSNKDNNNNNSNNNSNGTDVNVPTFQQFYPYPPSSQPPLLQSYPPFMPPGIPPLLSDMNNNINAYNNYNNNNNSKKTTRRINRYSLSGNRGRRLSIISNRENSIIMPHSDVPTNEYYRHLTDSNTSNKLKQLFTWCSIKTYQDLKIKESQIIQNKQNLTKDDTNGTISTYLNSKKMTLDIINDFINDLQHGEINIDWSLPMDSQYTSHIEHKNDVDNDNTVNKTHPSTKEDPLLKELFDDDGDDESKINKDDTDNFTYYDDGINKRKFKKIPFERPVVTTKQATQSTKQKINRIEKLLPNPKNAENEKNLQLLNDRIDKLKNEINEWKEVIDNRHPDAEWNSIMEIVSNSSSSDCVDGNELANEISELNLDFSNLKSELSERMNNLQSHTHLYKAHTESLIESVSHRIDILMTEFKRKQKLKPNNPRNTRNFFLNLSRARSK